MHIKFYNFSNHYTLPIKQKIVSVSTYLQKKVTLAAHRAIEAFKAAFAGLHFSKSRSRGVNRSTPNHPQTNANNNTQKVQNLFTNSQFSSPKQIAKENSACLEEQNKSNQTLNTSSTPTNKKISEEDLAPKENKHDNESSTEAAGEKIVPSKGKEPELIISNDNEFAQLSITNSSEQVQGANQSEENSVPQEQPLSYAEENQTVDENEQEEQLQADALKNKELSVLNQAGLVLSEEAAVHDPKDAEQDLASSNKNQDSDGGEEIAPEQDVLQIEPEIDSEEDQVEENQDSIQLKITLLTEQGQFVEFPNSNSQSDFQSLGSKAESAVANDHQSANDKDNIEQALVPVEPKDASGNFFGDLMASTANVAYAVWEFGKDIAKSIGQAGKARREFLKGVDLEPMSFEAYLKSQASVKVGMQSMTELWNAPSAEYDALTANLMQGFINQFGIHLHFLLLNAANLEGPELAGELAVKLDLYDKFNPLTPKSLSKFSNPLGWGALMFKLMQMGMNIHDIVQTSVLKRLENTIDQYVHDLAIKAGFKEEIILRFQARDAQKRAKIIFEKEIESFKQDLIEKHGIKELSSLKTDWYKEYVKQYAPSTYLSAEKTYTNACNYYETLKGSVESGGGVAWQPFADLTLFLNNTADKTLNHFLEDISAQMDAVSVIPPAHKKLVDQGLKYVVVGHQKAGPSSLMGTVIRQGVQAGNKFNELCDNPAKPIKQSFKSLKAEVLKKGTGTISEPVLEASLNFNDPINKGLGRLGGQVLAGAGVTKMAINCLHFQNLNLFDKKQLEFPVVQWIKESTLISDPVKEGLVELMSGDEDGDDNTINLQLNDHLQFMVQQIGREAATMFSQALAYYLKKILADKAQSHTAEKLMTEEVHGSKVAEIVQASVNGLSAAVKGLYN